MSGTPPPSVILRAEALERRLPRYFTSKPCPKGHVAERFTHNTRCVACAEKTKAKQRRAP